MTERLHDKKKDRFLCRVVRVLQHKTITFVWVWAGHDLYQCLVPCNLGVIPSVGSVIAVEGSWQPYQGKRTGFSDEELVADKIDVLAKPEDSNLWLRQWPDPDQRQALYARSMALAAVEEFFRQRFFTRIETPLIVGSQATIGATEPFVVQAKGEHGFLTVNNIFSHHKYHQNSVDSIYQLSRLFWAQKYNNRYSLNEFSLLEYSLTAVSRAEMITLTEEILEVIRETLLTIELDDHSLHNTSLRGLPVMTFDEVLTLAKNAGLNLNPKSHTLPVSVDGIISDRLGTLGFWIVDSPAEANPFYSKRITVDSREYGCSMELRLSGVPNVGAGSEWNTDPAKAEALTSSWAHTSAGNQYLSLLQKGLPDCVGFTLGIDRLLMYFLGLSNIRSLTVEPRVSSSFSGSPAAIHEDSVIIEPENETFLPRPETIKSVSAALQTVMESLNTCGFLPCTSSIIGFSGVMTEQATVNASEIPSPLVKYFGRSVPLIRDRTFSHGKILAAGQDRLYEIGPVFSNTSWWQPLWQLDVSWIEENSENVCKLALTTLQILVRSFACSPSEFARSIEELTPNRLLAENEATDGKFQWSWNDQVVIKGGLWRWQESELDRHGRHAQSEQFSQEFKDFMKMTPPPAGGFSLVLSNIPEFFLG